MAWPFPPLWKAAPTQLTLGKSDVHLWLASVPDCLPQLARLRELLTPDERERAARFHFERDRDRYAIARAILRDLLASYIGTSQFAFATNNHGKPSLEPPHHPLEFNVSHSGDLVLFGFTRTCEIGVDVERIRPDFATLEIANRFFAPDEAKVLAGLSERERTAAFFNCWTRKEAYIKARGVGLSLGLSTFAVTLKSSELPALVRVDADPDAPNRWTILDLAVGDDYRAAAAFEALECSMSHFRWGHNPS